MVLFYILIGPRAIEEAYQLDQTAAGLNETIYKSIVNSMDTSPYIVVYVHGFVGCSQ